MPRSRSRPITRNSCSVSRDDSDEDGSSISTIRLSQEVAFRISTICVAARPRRFIGRVGSRSRPTLCSMAPAWAIIALRRTSPSIPVVSWPISRFCHRRISGIGASSCGMIDTPIACAALGSNRRTVSPNRATVPRSGASWPATSLNSVDLPAPFSPASTLTVPGMKLTDTSRSTGTPSKPLPSPAQAIAGTAPSCAAARRVDGAIIPAPGPGSSRPPRPSRPRRGRRRRGRPAP